jgi:hypothetical protein
MKMTSDIIQIYDMTVVNKFVVSADVADYRALYETAIVRLRFAKEKGGRTMREKQLFMIKVIELPRVGGLHHRYECKEAA